MGGSWSNRRVETGSHKTVLERMLWQTTREVEWKFFTFSILSHLFWVSYIYNEPGLVLHFFPLRRDLIIIYFLKSIVSYKVGDFPVGLATRNCWQLGGNIELDVVSTDFMLHLFCRKMNTSFSNSRILLKCVFRT